MSMQNIINVVFAIAIAFLLWANQGQGLILAEVETRVNMMESFPPKTELEVCADAIEGTPNSASGGNFDRRQAILLCNN